MPSPDTTAVFRSLRWGLLGLGFALTLYALVAAVAISGMFEGLFTRSSRGATGWLPWLVFAELGIAGGAVALGFWREAPRAYWYAAAPGAFAVLTSLKYWLAGW